MNSHTTSKLEAAGWTFGDAKDFLNLSDEEAAAIDRRLAGWRAHAVPPGARAGVDERGEPNEGAPSGPGGSENGPLA